MNVEQEIDVLRRQVKALRQEVRMHGEWLDTVNSPWPKRVWWFLMGWRYYRLGRWYGGD